MWKVGGAVAAWEHGLESKQEMQQLDISTWEGLLERTQPNISRKQVGAVTV
jgi:hypothetical protein